METMDLEYFAEQYSEVLTVPMRNGNCLANCCTSVRSTPGSYRTYEELKLPVEL